MINNKKKKKFTKITKRSFVADERDGGDRGEDERAATITFPVDRAMVRGGVGRVTVIKSVVRVHVGAAERDAAGRGTIDVYARLTGVGPSERPSLVAAGLTWPKGGGGGGRWRDVDVTRLFRRPRRRHEAATALELELELRYPAAGALRLGDDDEDGRSPVLHAFLEGALPDDGTRPEAARCSAGETKRKKRDGASGGGGGGGKKRRKPPSSTGRVRRTDCKADGTGSGGGNGTEPTRNKCCREQMRVVFADIPGFDFIAEPKWFDAGLCRGRCPAKYNPATRHAFIQSMMWKQHKNDQNNKNGGDDDDDDRNRGPGSGDGDAGRRRGRRKVRHRGAAAAGSASSSNRAPPKPCCAPSKLDRLQIVHVDEADPSRLKVTTWEEMAVVECACS